MYETEVDLFHRLSVGDEYKSIGTRSAEHFRPIFTMRVLRKTRASITVARLYDGRIEGEHTYRLSRFRCGGLPPRASSEDVSAQERTNRRGHLLRQFATAGYFGGLSLEDLEGIDVVVRNCRQRSGK